MFRISKTGYRHREISELLRDRDRSGTGARNEQVDPPPAHRQRPGKLSILSRLLGTSINDVTQFRWKGVNQLESIKHYKVINTIKMCLISFMSDPLRQHRLI